MIAHQNRGKSPAVSALSVLVAIVFVLFANLASAVTITVSKAGSGAGTVTSSVGAIVCAANCSDNYATATEISFRAVPNQGSQFTGWLGPCSGVSTCQFTIASTTTLVATFATPASSGPALEIDGNLSTGAETDGQLVGRYLMGLSGMSLISGAVGSGATRDTAIQIEGYLNDVRPMLDIDGDGRLDALTDALLVSRYLSGQRGANLINGTLAANATRTTATDVEKQIGRFLTSSVPSNPIAFNKNTVLTMDSGTTNYVWVPTAYDATHSTPIKLLVWLHGCGGVASGDIYVVTLGSTQSYISVAVGGREGLCWNMGVDSAKVLAAVGDLKNRFNIDPRGVILGGYSSGGDLAYRTAFYNADLFAGVLAENTSPFRDTGSSQASSLAAATWKFNVVHLAHLSDSVYPISGVRAETDALSAAGFPMTRIEKAGSHYDADSGSAGTVYDLRTFLLPYLDAGWLSP